MVVEQQVCGGSASPVLSFFLLLVKAINTLYTVILAYHTIQHVEYCLLAISGERASGNWCHKIVPQVCSGRALIKAWFYLACIHFAAVS